MTNTNLVKLHPNTDSQVLNIFNDYAEVENLILHNNIIVETSYVNGFGNFKWKIPANLFHKTPLRQLKKEDKNLSDMNRINEYFEIEFVCEEVKNEKSDIERNLTWLKEFGFNFFTYTKINNISFNVAKHSELTYSELLFSLKNHSDFLNYCLRKDYIVVPSSGHRKLFPFDLQKATELAYKEVDDEWSDPSPLKDYFEEIINSEN